MIEFKPLSPDDYEKAAPKLRAQGIENSEHCFATMLVWGQRQPIDIGYSDGALFMRSDGGDHLWYLYPRGDIDEKKAIEEIFDDARRQGKEPWIYGIDEKRAEFLMREFSDRLIVEEDRDTEDYIYLSSDLINLPGKKYQKKRNHCSKFTRENPDYKLIPISSENIDRAKEFEYWWSDNYNSDGSRDLASEQKGILLLLDNFEKLELMGAMIETNGEIVALSIAALISDEMVDVVVEKAHHDVSSAYAVINRDFAAHSFSKFKYINREDDMGEENLRTAKMRYFPYEIKKKFIAISR